MSYGKIKIIKNAKVFESDSGYYGYWYPNNKKFLETKNDCFAEHLSNWRHQGSFIPFSIDQKDLGFEESKKVCVWIKKESLPYYICEQ